MFRNKWLLFVVAFLCISLFTSCNKAEETTYRSEFFFSSPKDQPIIQSLSKNTNQNALGTITIDQGDTYYVSQSNAGIERISADGKLHEWVLKDYVNSFFICGDWLFYTNQDYTLNRMKKDASVMSKEGIDCFQAALDNRWLYFTAEERNEVHLFRARLDGNEYTEIITDSISPNFIIGNFTIFYQLHDGSLRRCSLRGNKKSEIGNVKTGKFVLSSNAIYYMNKEDGNCLYKIECNGKNNQRITSAAIIDFDVTENGIYYTLIEDEQSQSNMDTIIEDCTLYYMEKANLTPAIITQGRITDIHGIENTVYFRKNGQLYQMENDNQTYRRVIAKGDCSEFLDASATHVFSLHSAGNFNNGGQVSIAEDSVLLSYHTDETDTLIQIQKDGTKERTISSRLLFYDVLVQGEEVYYKIDTQRASWVQSTLQRKSLTSNPESSFSTLLDFSCSYLVQNDSLFFSSSWYTTFFRQNLTTGKRYCLSNDTATCINLYKEHLYFINEDKTIVKLQVDGSTRIVLREKATSALTTDEDALYYIGEGGFLYTMDLEGKNEKLFLQEPIGKFNLSDQWVYYIPQTKPSQVWRISKNGDRKEIVYSDVCYGIYTHQETVYLYGFTENQYCIIQVFPNKTFQKFYPFRE